MLWKSLLPMFLSTITEKKALAIGLELGENIANSIRQFNSFEKVKTYVKGFNY